MRRIATFLLALLLPLTAQAATEYFGQFATGGNADNLNANQLLCSLFTAPADVQTLNSLSYFSQAVTTSGQLKGIVFSSTGTFLAASAPFTFTGTGWATTSISLALTAGTSYCFGLIYSAGGAANGQYDFTASGGPSKVQSSNNFTSPTNATFSNVSNYTMTVYAAYTPTGGSTPALFGYFSSFWW